MNCDWPSVQINDVVSYRDPNGIDRVGTVLDRVTQARMGSNEVIGRELLVRPWPDGGTAVVPWNKVLLVRREKPQ